MAKKYEFHTKNEKSYQPGSSEHVPLKVLLFFEVNTTSKLKHKSHTPNSTQ